MKQKEITDNDPEQCLGTCDEIAQTAFVFPFWYVSLLLFLALRTFPAPSCLFHFQMSNKSPYLPEAKELIHAHTRNLYLHVDK